MKKMIKPILLVSLLATCASASAYNSYFEYEHWYGSKSHFHGDKFGISVDFDQQAYVGLNVDLINQEKNKLFYDDIVSNFYEMYAGYNFKLTDNLVLTPNFEMRYYSGGGYKAKSANNMPAYIVGDVSDSMRPGARYTPGLKLTWSAMDNLDVYTQYRYEYRLVSRNKREDAVQGYVGNRMRNRIDVGVQYSPINDLTIAYRFSYLKGNYVLHDQKKRDYQQEVKLNWQATSEWGISFATEDVARSLENNKREAKLKFGVTYAF